jgi:hypothetical protein
MAKNKKYMPHISKHISILVFFIPFFLYSQSDTAAHFRLKSVTGQTGFNFITLNDPYLSPLQYRGNGLNINHSGHRFLFDDNAGWSSEERLSLLAGILYNPSNTSAMALLEGAASWGIHRRWQAGDKFRILAGGNLGGLLGVKYIARNVNNPVNADFAVNINLSTLLQYKFVFRKLKFNTQLRLELPALGCMFVPHQGASYYEMFDIGNLSNAFHFTSLHNRRGLEYGFSIAFPLRKSTLVADIAGNILRYKANSMLYKFDTSSISIGWKYDLYIFSGTKKTAPNNFLSTEF